jgi:hypothetical protein
MRQVSDLVDRDLDRQHHFSARCGSFVQHWSNYYQVTTPDQKVTRVIGETVDQSRSELTKRKAVTYQPRRPHRRAARRKRRSL